jgi:hypothetical protein
MSRLLAASLASLGIAACAHEPVLRPAPGTPVEPGNQNVALTEVLGVGISVAGDAWKGDPPNLAEIFTPVQVTIVNNSGKTLRVGYRDFSLTGNSGFTYPAIPPLKAKGQVSASRARAEGRFQLASYQLPPVHQLVLTDFDQRRFYIAPHMAWFYPGLEPWPYAFPYDPLYFDTLYAHWPKQLPTKDMLAKALPEGAVQNGGHVAGFVYFQSVKKRESNVQFNMTLVDASNGQSFGEMHIPFVVRK